MIQEIFQSHHGLQDRTEIISAGEAKATDSPHGIDIESDAAFPELEPGHLAPGQAPDEPLVDFPEGYLRGPEAVNGGPHGLGLEHEEEDLGLLGPQAQSEGVPSVMGQDGEVGGQKGHGRRKRKLLVVVVVMIITLVIVVISSTVWWETK
ncbi:hypothetical protein TorRG33x02_154310 [Trema orientale]|uniref:Transmembrane protein n=1 Tax=Trema orientale TaxID=63057 RepID=A0A2P5ET90_TREOI|nr:hypothetical protein TorRG33x02_154310 [Trema orientale]